MQLPEHFYPAPENMRKGERDYVGRNIIELLEGYRNRKYGI